MKVYVMLPFEYRRYISERVGTAVKLTPDYAKRFKNVTFLYHTTIGDVGKIARYNPRRDMYWLYTTISPETFELYEGKVGM